MWRTQKPISSNGQIWRALVVLTLFSILTSVALSIIALLFTTTGKPGAVMPESEVWLNVLVCSVLLPGTICPLVVYKLLTTLRELNLARTELAAIAARDPLTGLLNRRGFAVAAEAEVQLARTTHHNVATLMCDIDFFKRINDTYGHDCGDAVIRHVADILTKTVAKLPNVAVGRQGGEEFAVLVSGLSIREITQLAETIRSAVESSPAVWEDNIIRITISLGTSITVSDDAEIRSLMVRADEALYEAKKRGRNRVEIAAIAKAA